MTKKSATQSAKPALIPQANGRGALATGGYPGNKGGGRPADAVRARLVKLAKGKGFRFLNGLMDGQVDVQFFGTCRKCGERQELPEDDDAVRDLMDRVGDIVTTSVDHRLKGLEQAHRYGLGKQDEISIRDNPEVQKLVSNLARATVEVFGAEGYKKLSDRITELEST